MKNQISFNTFISEKWAKKNKIFSPKHWINDINSFLKNQKLYKQFKNGRFFIKCTVEYVEITRRQKGYFGYKNIIINNAFVEVYGNKAFIYRNSSSYSLIKIVTGKYFKMSGKEVTKRTYNKYYKIDFDKLELERKESENRRLQQLEKQKEELNKTKKIIKSQLTQEMIIKWTDDINNQGNSHTRRNRWANRALRICIVNCNGTILRDICYEELEKIKQNITLPCNEIIN